MSFIAEARRNLRASRYEQENDRVLTDYLTRHLERRDLQELMALMSHPEVGTPVMAHADLLLKQPELDRDLHEQFASRIKRQPESPLRAKALAQFSLKTNPPGEARLASQLKTLTENEPKTVSLNERIKQTYDVIKQQARAALDRFSLVKIPAASIFRSQHRQQLSVMAAATNYATGLKNRVMPAFDLLKDGLTRRLAAVKADYATRRLTYQNDTNLTAALTQGLDADTLRDGIESMSLPEIRYPMVHNAAAVLAQDAMTPQLADEFFKASSSYVSTLRESHPLRQSFQAAFDAYDARTAVKKTSAQSSAPTKKPVSETRTQLGTPLSNPALKRDVKQAELSGFTSDGKATYDTPQGTQHEETIGEMLASQYPFDYIPDDLPAEPPETSALPDAKGVSADERNSQAFIDGLENLAPPEDAPTQE